MWPFKQPVTIDLLVNQISKLEPQSGGGFCCPSPNKYISKKQDEINSLLKSLPFNLMFNWIDSDYAKLWSLEGWNMYRRCEQRKEFISAKYGLIAISKDSYADNICFAEEDKNILLASESGRFEFYLKFPEIVSLIKDILA